MKTWKVLRWDDKPAVTRQIDLACNKCLTDAVMEIGEPGALIIAAMGLGLIFDPPGHVPPPNFMPTEIQCRHCKTVWAIGERESVR